MISLAAHDLPSLRHDLTSRGLNSNHARRLLIEFYNSNGSPDVTVQTYGKGIVEYIASLPGISSTIARESRSLDGTVKILVQFSDGATAESVLMPSHRPGDAAGCVSSQVGCAMGCDFCASTKNGFQRNLTTAEIVEQFLHLKRVSNQMNRRLRTIVFMGMGEPLNNFENVVGAIRRIADPELGALGWRHVTVSTVGVVEGIDRLAAENLNVHFALSLHAPDDATRARIVPTGKKWRVAEILAAADRFYASSGRIPTIEYTLLAGINDSDDQAKLLAELLKNRRFHVNLIPYNPIGPGLSGFAYQRPTADRMNAFLDILREAKVVAHFRRTRGDDVAAACGQLRQLAG